MTHQFLTLNKVTAFNYNIRLVLSHAAFFPVLHSLHCRQCVGGRVGRLTCRNSHFLPHQECPS